MITRNGSSYGDRTGIRVAEGGGREGTSCQISVAGSSVMIASLIPLCSRGAVPGTSYRDKGQKDPMAVRQNTRRTRGVYQPAEDPAEYLILNDDAAQIMVE
jgi:hypothetical protein